METEVLKRIKAKAVHPETGKPWTFEQLARATGLTVNAVQTMFGRYRVKECYGIAFTAVMVGWKPGQVQIPEL